MKGKRYSRKFQRMAVERMRSSENIGALAQELGALRKISYGPPLEDHGELRCCKSCSCDAAGSGAGAFHGHFLEAGRMIRRLGFELFGGGDKCEDSPPQNGCSRPFWPF